MTSAVRKFVMMPPGDRRTFAWAWLMLGWTRAAILAGRFRFLVRGLEHHRVPPKAAPLARAESEQAIRIGRLVARAARHTPWESACLAQVLVTQRLLARRGIPGQFHLGARLDRDSPPKAAELSAHAWLVCGERVVNGVAGHERFAIVSTYSWR